MTADQVRRAAAGAAVAGAVIGVPADLYHFTIDSRVAASGTTAFRVHGPALIVAFALSLVALAGLALARGDRDGRLGAVASAMTLLGTTFVVGNVATEAFALPLAPDELRSPEGYYLAVIVASFATWSLGWLLTAVASLRAGVLARGPAALLVVGALLAFPPIPGSYVVLLVAIAVAATRASRGGAAEATTRHAREMSRV